MYGNNAYNKYTFNDILVVQGSIITVTKLTNNKSLLSQFYCLLNRTTRIARKHLDYHSELQRSYTGSCILASLARNVKAEKKRLILGVLALRKLTSRSRIARLIIAAPRRINSVPAYFRLFPDYCPIIPRLCPVHV